MLRNLVSFLRARSWNDSRRILDEHPELLYSAASDMLAIMIQDPQTTAMVYPGLSQAKRDPLLREHLGLLRRCREVGVGRAFAELEGR
ncbi:hypothetical protein [Acrocarpospora corrugata]|nr:hypothetical protein [Acrocarpospora corrugata]